ncbi:MAG TPA: hypothetical protein VD736_07655 [Nitrososphaera sp.]|nr:hypothetical protein [Nitrososphaera sp.]
MFAALVQANLAYGHFFVDTKDIDRFQVVFAPFPQNPEPGGNSTLNFSILENNSNIYNIHAAVVIAEKSGDVVDQIPYKPYEFSDITVPYTFEEAGDYVVKLQARIIGDEKYQASPLEASFDISVGQLPFDELMLFYVTPAAVAIAAIVVYLHSKKML